jgi:hypothetical protein
VGDFIRCLKQHLHDRQLPEDTAYWVCAYANNQHRLGDEIPSNMDADGLVRSSFYRALMSASVVGVLAVVDSRGTVFSRIWCCFEMYLALVADRDGQHEMLFDAYTALPDGRAVGLSDGQAAVDLLATVDDTATTQVARESSFPPELFRVALGFRFLDAVASSEQDMLAIRQLVGDSAAALQATVRASFGVHQLGRLLRCGPRTDLESTLAGLRASQLRKLVVSVSTEGGGDAIPPDEAGHMLGRALPPSLQELVLAKFSPSVLAAVAGAVRGGNLRVLDIGLTLTPVSAAQVGLLSDALRAGGARLRFLALDSTGVDDACCRLLGHALK